MKTNHSMYLLRNQIYMLISRLQDLYEIAMVYVMYLNLYKIHY